MSEAIKAKTNKTQELNQKSSPLNQKAPSKAKSTQAKSPVNSDIIITSKTSPKSSKQKSNKLKAKRAAATNQSKKPLSFANLRQRAVDLFRKRYFKEASALFSLAHQLKPSTEILYFIDLCELAKQDEDGVTSLFELYYSGIIENQEKNLATIIEIIEKTSYAQIPHISSDTGISYEDFCEIVRQNGDFNATFESVIHSTRIVISNKKSLVDFISRLIDGGYTELAVKYIEDTSSIIANELETLAQKLKAKNDL